MAENDVNINLGVDSKDAVKGLKNFEKASKETVSGVEKAFNGLKSVAVAAAGIFAARQILKGFDAVIDAASRQQDAVNKLNTALKTSGEFSEAASQDIQNFASALQASTKFGDEAILEQVALAKAFGATNEQAKQVTEAAIELSAATGKSLDEATRQVSKTLGGFAGELGEVNPAIKALTKEQLAAGEAAKILIAQYGGSAAAQIQTFSGATAQLGNSYGDLLEKFGQFIVESPIVIGALNFISNAFASFGEFINSNKDSINDLITAMFTFAVEGAQFYISGIRTILVALSIWTEAIKSVINLIPGLSTAFTLVVEGIKTAITALVGAFSFLKKTVEQIFGIVLSTAKAEDKNIFDSLESSLAKVSDGLGDFKTKVTTTNKDVEKSYTQTAAKVVNIATKQTAAQVKQAEDTAKKTVEAFEGLEKEFANFAKDEIAIVRETEKNRLAIIDQALKDRLIAEERAVKLREKVEGEAQKSLAAIEKKAADEREKQKDDVALIKKGTVEQVRSGLGEGAGNAVGSIASLVNPISAAVNAIEGVVGLLQKLIDIIPNLINAVANIFSSLAELPLKIGEAIGNLIDALLKFVIEFIPNIFKSASKILLRVVQFFFKELPKAITELLTGLPDLIRTLIPILIDAIIELAQNIGPIATALVEALIEAQPRIILALVDSLIVNGGIFRIAAALAKALAIDLPIALARGFLNAIVSLGTGAFTFLSRVFSDAIKFPDIKLPKLEFGGEAATFFKTIGDAFTDISKIFREIAKALGQGGGDGFIASAGDKIAGGINSTFGTNFATGGLVPPGFPNDTFPAKLTSGEQVIDRTDNKRLSQFLDRQEQGGDSQTVVIQLKIGENQLADAIYKLNRKGFRTA